MKLRLAFGVVAQLRPRVLIVDEVIAVGDLRFQARCLERIRELRSDGTAVRLASDSLEAVGNEGDRAVWLPGSRLGGGGASSRAARGSADAVGAGTMKRTP